ncbi:hypothetical protein FG877_17375, partial [Enterococcus casseliflavus]|nr:hypothetical protein [Enterococcus casseliflavus]
MKNQNKFLHLFATSLIVGSTFLTTLVANAGVTEIVPTSYQETRTTNDDNKKNGDEENNYSQATQQSAETSSHVSTSDVSNSEVTDQITTMNQAEQATTDTSVPLYSTAGSITSEKQAAVADESIDSWMPDPVLQQAVSEKLNIPIDQLTKDDLIRLRTLTVSGASSLKGMEYATEIIQLNALNGSITDLSPVSGITNLEVLNVRNNNITNLSIISTLSSLKTLTISDNPISDLPDFSQNSKLTTITGSNCSITDLTSLNTLPQHATVYFQNQVLININLLIDVGSSSVSSGGIIKNIDGTWADPVSLIPTPNSSWDGTNFTFLTQGDYNASFKVAGNSMISLDYNAEVHFHVDKRVENVKIEYLNEEDNQPIHDPIMISGLIGDSYDATTSLYKLEIVGFILDETKLPSNSTGTISNTATVIRYYYKKDKTSVSVHDSTIYVGDEWQAKDNFDSALDKDGNPVDFADITVDDSQMDPSKVGTYEV